MTFLIKLTPKVLAHYWMKVDRSGGPDACHIWTAAKAGRGYGRFWIEGSLYYAHRIAWIIVNNQDIPPSVLVCHSCDNPACCNPRHLWLGTHTDNTRDMVEKGRVAAGDRHGSRTKPDRVARGDRNGSRTKPERVARGDRHYSRTNPEKMSRGQDNGSAKLTEDQVRKIRAGYAAGGITQQALAAKYEVSQVTISQIIRRKKWSYVL
jgi:hypothetical protein